MFDSVLTLQHTSDSQRRTFGALAGTCVYCQSSASSVGESCRGEKACYVFRETPRKGTRVATHSEGHRLRFASGGPLRGKPHQHNVSLQDHTCRCSTAEFWLSL